MDYGRDGWDGDIAQPFVFHACGFGRGLRFTLRGRQRLPFPTKVDLGWFDRMGTRVVPMWGIAKQAGFRVSRVTCADERVDVSQSSQDALRIATGALDVGTPIDTFVDVMFEDGMPVSKQRIWIGGMASGGLVVEPEDVKFGLVRVADRPVTQKVRIRSEDGRPFELTHTAVDKEYLSIEVSQKIPTEAVCHVTLDPQHPQAIDGWVTLSTTDGLRGVKFRCVGTVE